MLSGWFSFLIWYRGNRVWQMLQFCESLTAVWVSLHERGSCLWDEFWDFGLVWWQFCYTRSCKGTGQQQRTRKLHPSCRAHPQICFLCWSKRLMALPCTQEEAASNPRKDYIRSFFCRVLKTCIKSPSLLWKLALVEGPIIRQAKVI